MIPTPAQTTLYAGEILLACLQEAGDDVEAGFEAAEYILNTQPIPDSVPSPAPNPVSSEEPSISAFFAHDIHNRRAQGVLNRSLKVVKGLSTAARKDLASILKRGEKDSGEAILNFIDKYRTQLAKLLSSTQLAALLEGAREVATTIPTLVQFPGAAPFPPSLEPKEAITLVNRLEELTGEARAEKLYNLPVDQQTYVQQALIAKEASPPIVPPRFTPPEPPSDAPEAIHFPVIDEAVKQLAEKNVMTREKFDALDAASRAKAFTVANVSAEETLTKIRDSLAENIREGVDYETWKEKILQDVDSGTFLSEAHQENIFRTAIQTQFSDGQETVLSHPLVRSGFPYRARDAIHDERVRENHIALEKLGIQGTNIYRANDPVWQLFRVPWDYNDRCSDSPMTVRQAAEAGIEEAQQWLETGVEPYPPAHVPMPSFQPPPGFRRAVAAAPLSIQLSMSSLLTFSPPDKPSSDGPPPTVFPTDREEYPRNSSNQFVNKYLIAAVSLDPDIAQKLREELPDDQRWKLDRAIAHLQSGGILYHPEEPLGMAIDRYGVIADHNWASYNRRMLEYKGWETRRSVLDEHRKNTDRAVEAVRASAIDLDKADNYLTLAGATRPEMRAISRMRHLVGVGKRDQDSLEELYESTAEAIHRRLDIGYDMDPEPERPEEPTPIPGR